jgi:hypothetical protein
MVKIKPMSKNDREFSVSDAVLLEHSEIIVETLPSDMPEFTAFDSTITVEYIPELEEAVAEVKAFPTDNVLIDEMAEHTLRVEQVFKMCYEDYKTIAYFVRKAFADNPAIRNQFGLNDIEKARISQPKMVVFMESLAKTAAKYQQQLVDAGCKLDLITGLSEKAAGLNEVNIEQEKFKNDRGINTQDRIRALNVVYRLLQPLHNAAEFIYRDDPVRYSIYTMPQPAPPPEPPENPETPV